MFYFSLINKCLRFLVCFFFYPRRQTRRRNWPFYQLIQKFVTSCNERFHGQIRQHHATKLLRDGLPILPVKVSCMIRTFSKKKKKNHNTKKIKNKIKKTKKKTENRYLYVGFEIFSLS